MTGSQPPRGSIHTETYRTGSRVKKKVNKERGYLFSALQPVKGRWTSPGGNQVHASYLLAIPQGHAQKLRRNITS